MSEERVRRRRGGGLGRLLGFLIILWPVIGAFAAYQRDYFKGSNDSCAHTGTVMVTIVAGPLNYVGANPKVHDCKVPQPSS